MSTSNVYEAGNNIVGPKWKVKGAFFRHYKEMFNSVISSGILQNRQILSPFHDDLEFGTP